MQFLIIGLLLTGPLTLYDVHKHFSAGMALFYSASFGSIRRALVQAEVSGWVVAYDDPGSTRRRRPYEVTDAGRAAWHDWMMAPISGADGEAKSLAKVFLLGELPAADRERCLAGLKAHASQTLAGLTALAEEIDGTAVDPTHAERFGFRRATLDYGIRTHRLALSWLDELGGDA